MAAADLPPFPAFPVVDRPARTRLHGATDTRLERALLTTLDTGRAIRVPLSRFHSSPAKGHLFKAGYRVLHRVSSRWGEFVDAWLEPKRASKA